MKRATIIIASLLFSTCVMAEEVEMFSRANCINNESITYDYFALPQWRLTFSEHIDHDQWGFFNGVKFYFRHLVASSPLSHCDFYNCWYFYEQTTRAAAIHIGEGGVPGVSTNWGVKGEHWHYLTHFGHVRLDSTASDCNLSYDQFN